MSIGIPVVLMCVGLGLGFAASVYYLCFVDSPANESRNTDELWVEDATQSQMFKIQSDFEEDDDEDTFARASSSNA